jgi:hypothetical protein
MAAKRNVKENLYKKTEIWLESVRAILNTVIFNVLKSIKEKNIIFAGRVLLFFIKLLKLFTNKVSSMNYFVIISSKAKILKSIYCELFINKCSQIVQK